MEYYHDAMTRLRKELDDRGLSLAKVAALTGLDVKTIWHASVGRKTNPSTRRLIALALGIAEADLFVESSSIPVIPEADHAA